GFTSMDGAPHDADNAWYGVAATLQQFARQLATTATDLASAAEALSRDSVVVAANERRSFEELFESGRLEIHQAVAEARQIRQSLEEMAEQFRAELERTGSQVLARIQAEAE